MKIVDEYLHNLQEIEPITTAALMAGLSAANLIVGATKLYKQHFTKAARMCSDLSPREKSMCMTRAKMLAKNVELQTLKGSMSKCTKAKDPTKCKERISGKMQKLAGEIKFLANRYEGVKKQQYTNAKK